MNRRQLEDIWGDLQFEFERKASLSLDKKVKRSKHAKEQMLDRDISWLDVIQVSKEMPEEFYLPLTYPPDNDNPDPVFTITGRDTKGRKLSIAIAVIHTNNKKPEVNYRLVTAMLVMKGSRHNKTNC